MSKIAFITGTIQPFGGRVDIEKKELRTIYGMIEYVESDDALFLPRHGINGNILPQIINHKGNITALLKLGIKNAVGIYSVGSLNMGIGLGSVLIPHDYINLGSIISLNVPERKHITPSLISPFRDRVISKLREKGVKVKQRGVYIQTKGPRLETKAEVNFYRNIADIIGMTMANESTLCLETGLEYCPVCFVDNYANGVISDELTLDTIKHGTEDSIKIARKIVNLLKCMD